VIGLAVSLLFISEQFQVFGLKAHGPFASWFGDADFGYFIGFIVAGVVYAVLNRSRAPQH
jgi:cytosine/uracil/thiamine/allantoin permease